MRTRLISIACLLALTPLSASAAEDTPSEGRSAPAPSRAASGAAGKAKGPPPALPAAPARVRVIAPSAEGLWTLRIDNEGERPMRVAADVRLLDLEVTTLDKRAKKTVRCSLPPALRPSDFPEKRGLLLPPGHSYIERFNPRLICFGASAASLVGGAVVKAWLGWSPPPAWSKQSPARPYVLESTDDPPAFAPARGLGAPTLVLSYAPALPGGWSNAAAAPPEPPEGRADEGADKGAGKDKDADKASARDADKAASAKGAGKPASGKDSDKATSDKDADKASAKDADKGAGKDDDADKATSDKDADKGSAGEANKAALADGKPEPGAEGAPAKDAGGAAPAKPPAIVDANAPRLELIAEPFADALEARSVLIRLQAKNVGKRPTTVALRSRMLEFRVQGPNGSTLCGASPPTGGIARDMFHTLGPGQSTDLSVLLAEVCPDAALDREGLYRVTATLHANEPGTDLGINGYTGVVRAKNATLLRLQTAPSPFYKRAPKAVPTPTLDDAP